MVRQAPLQPTRSAFWKRLRRVGHYVLMAGSFGIVALFAVTAIGFFRFTDKVANLPVPADIGSYEGIVALTGGYQRIDTAVDLLEHGAGQRRLLITGVNPVTSGMAIKNATGASEEVFSCCVDIGYQAIDTIGNANEAAGWIQKNGYHRVLVVTNNYHIPRSLMELSAASPDVEFVGYPVTHRDLKSEDWLSDPMAVRTLVTEYFKYAFATVRNWFGDHDWKGLRAGAPEPGPAITASLAD